MHTKITGKYLRGESVVLWFAVVSVTNKSLTVQVHELSKQRRDNGDRVAADVVLGLAIGIGTVSRTGVGLYSARSERGREELVLSAKAGETLVGSIVNNPDFNKEHPGMDPVNAFRGVVRKIRMEERVDKEFLNLLEQVDILLGERRTSGF